MSVSGRITTALVATTCILCSAIEARADYPINYEASLTGTASSGDFAPFYINSLRHGRLTAAHNALAEGRAWRDIDRGKRFSYGFGVDFVTGWSSGNSYARYDATSGWGSNDTHPPRIWLQQLYGEVKYRGVFLTVGLKEHDSALLNHRLSSGDMVESGNTRPTPEVRVGFIDFQDIPLTNGWVQIQGEIGYGRMTDGDWWLDRYNRYNYHVNTGEWYNYKRCYFRTKPSERFSVTLGMQAAATFGGRCYHYHHGVMTSERDSKVTLKTLWNAFLPIHGNGEDFYEGNHLGSWDLMARYSLGNGDEVKAYFQWPWEDGSGIGRRNGWDGLWGVEWRSANSDGYVTGVVAEYIDMTNQSGPQHYAPGDFPGNTIGSESTGADDYYNNQYYNAYAHYGMSIGSPMVMAPIFNLDGYPAYVANRMRGFHVGAEGKVNREIGWRVRGGYRVGYGNGRVMLPKNIHSTSVSADVSWHVEQVKGLDVTGTLAFDHGTMPGNSVGGMVTVSYSGILNIGHK